MQTDHWVTHSDTETGVAPGLTRHRNMRSRYRCSMWPAIHINSHSWLCSSSIHEPSDPPLRVDNEEVALFLCLSPVKTMNSVFLLLSLNLFSCIHSEIPDRQFSILCLLLSSSPLLFKSNVFYSVCYVRQCSPVLKIVLYFFMSLGFHMHFISLYGVLSLHNCSSSGSLVFTRLGSINLDCALNNNSTDSYISYRGIYSC